MQTIDDVEHKTENHFQIPSFYFDPFCVKKSFTGGIQIPYDLTTAYKRPSSPVTRAQESLFFMRECNALERIFTNREITLTRNFNDAPLSNLLTLNLESNVINNLSDLEFDSNTEYIFKQQMKHWNKENEFKNYIPHRYLQDQIREVEFDPGLSSEYVGNQICIFKNDNLDLLLHASGPIMNILRTKCLTNSTESKLEFMFPILQISAMGNFVALRFMYELVILRWDHNWIETSKIQYETRAIHVAWMNGGWGIETLCVLTEDGSAHLWRANGEISEIKVVDSPFHAAYFQRIEFGAHPQTLLSACQDSVTLVDMRQGRPKRALSTEGIGITAFAKDPSNHFHYSLATTKSIKLYDIRMVRHPILLWETISDDPIRNICIIKWDSDRIMLAHNFYNHNIVAHGYGSKDVSLNKNNDSLPILSRIATLMYNNNETVMPVTYGPPITAPSFRNSSFLISPWRTHSGQRYRRALTGLATLFNEYLTIFQISEHGDVFKQDFSVEVISGKKLCENYQREFKDSKVVSKSMNDACWCVEEDICRSGGNMGDYREYHLTDISNSARTMIESSHSIEKVFDQSTMLALESERTAKINNVIMMSEEDFLRLLAFILQSSPRRLDEIHSFVEQRLNLNISADNLCNFLTRLESQSYRITTYTTAIGPIQQLFDVAILEDELLLKLASIQPNEDKRIIKVKLLEEENSPQGIKRKIKRGRVLNRWKNEITPEKGSAELLSPNTESPNTIQGPNFTKELIIQDDEETDAMTILFPEESREQYTPMTPYNDNVMQSVDDQSVEDAMAILFPDKSPNTNGDTSHNNIQQLQTLLSPVVPQSTPQDDNIIKQLFGTTEPSYIEGMVTPVHTAVQQTDHTSFSDDDGMLVERNIDRFRKLLEIWQQGLSLPELSQREGIRLDFINTPNNDNAEKDDEFYRRLFGNLHTPLQTTEK